MHKWGSAHLNRVPIRWTGVLHGRMIQEYLEASNPVKIANPRLVIAQLAFDGSGDKTIA